MRAEKLKIISFLLRLLALALLLLARHYGLFTFFGAYQLQADITISFLIFALTASVLVSSMAWFYRHREKIPAGKADNVIIGLNNIYYILLVGAGIMTILGYWGIDFKTLFTTLSIVAAAIAIISKDYISEIISGIIISFSGEVAIGDYIRIGDQKGKIIDINFTKIALLNEDDDVIFIPNAKFFSSEIINYTKREIKKVSIEFEVMIQNIKTIEELETDLIHAISDYEGNIEAGSYNLKIGNITKDSLSLKFQYTFKEINRELEKDIRRKTVRRIVNYVKSNLRPS
ncbi:MAG: mechanosensitive ion channel [Phaeodactylibacter sp.]|nr:mechanosensitive ion channel [Phaeodactylibacter sp.]MCB9265418.1 mechanosensitive ion channel [Lewinellaceae bacterium]MCB9289815.1 mechanosensitive ion channel [Lewinellaceae bacterium]